MKKRIKLFLAAAIAAIVSVAAGLYSYNATHEKLLAQEQELVLVDDNVEALTYCESSIDAGWKGTLSIVCEGKENSCSITVKDYTLICNGNLVQVNATGPLKLFLNAN